MKSFVEKSNEVHNFKYDYSEMVYVNCKTEVTIICPIHGPFLQKPKIHASGSGCKKCAIESTSKKLSKLHSKGKEQFIVDAKKEHNEFYTYDKIVDYVNGKTKVLVTCPLHGDFLVRPNDHLSKKSGCPECKKVTISKLKKFDIEDVKASARAVHGDKYDYSLMDYVDCDTKVKIKCPIHGIFEQSTYAHINNKAGCPHCWNEINGERMKVFNKDRKILKREFLERANEVHNNKYTYIFDNGFEFKKKIKIICPVEGHGEFEQSGANHVLLGCGCPKCQNESQKITKEEFDRRIRELYDDKYKTVEYDCITQPAIMNCKKHGDYEIRMPSNMIFRSPGCPECRNSKQSIQEKEVVSFIKEHYTGKIIENTRSLIAPLEIDIYLPEINLAIEYNGLYWHSERHKPNDYHINKTESCNEQNINLIHIYEDDWVNKNELVKALLLDKLNIHKLIIQEYECEIRMVDHPTAKKFLIDNHISGNCPNKIRIGLYHKNELVSLMIFGKTRLTTRSVTDKDDVYEMLRFCNRINTKVVDGELKMFNHFLEVYKPKQITAYSDRAWFMENGNILSDLGFSLSKKTASNYWYIVDDKRVNRINYRKDVLVKEGFPETESEHLIMLKRNIFRIYNAGYLKYVFG